MQCRVTAASGHFSPAADINFPLNRYKLTTAIPSLSRRDYTLRPSFSYLLNNRLSYLSSSNTLPLSPPPPPPPPSFFFFSLFLLLFLPSIFRKLIYILWNYVRWDWNVLLGKLIQSSFALPRSKYFDKRRHRFTMFKWDKTFSLSLSLYIFSLVYSFRWKNCFY